MRRETRIPILQLLLLFTIGACVDAPSSITSEVIGDPQLARGGTVPPATLVLLGQHLYQDENLSVRRNQSCQTCHEPSEGFAGGDANVTRVASIIEGSVAGEFGARKPPTAAYATLSPLFSSSGNASGGNFWDGRATGAILGNPAADQALGPFLNPVEQALPDAACIVFRVRYSSYLTAYTNAWGTAIQNIAFPSNTDAVCSTPTTTPGNLVALSAADRQAVLEAYYNVARSIKEFEASFNVFTARFDRAQLTALEQEGAKLFGGKGKCQQCHTNKGARAAFTDYKFHNLGVPRHPANPVFNYATGAADLGLGGFTGNASHAGKFKTPTVRNVALGAHRTYMHNGVFANLKQVVDFYNTRDVLRVCTPTELQTLLPAQYGSYDPDGGGVLTAAGCWPPPETPRNLDSQNMGNLGLTEAQVDAIVAFMRALTDGS